MSIVTDEILEKAYAAAHGMSRWGEICAALEAVADDLVKAEREACAAVADRWGAAERPEPKYSSAMACECIAYVIRHRGRRQ